MKKRIFSILLALCMVISILPVTTFAAIWERAVITGLSVTIDDVIYDDTNTSAGAPAIIEPDSTITVTAYGTHLDLATEDQFVSFGYIGDSLDSGNWSISEDGATATKELMAEDFFPWTSGLELTYRNGSEAVGSGVYVIYVDNNVSAEITGLSIKIDDVIYDHTNTSADRPATIVPDSTITVTAYGTNLHYATEDNIVCYLPIGGSDLTHSKWTLNEDGTAATATLDANLFANYTDIYQMKYGNEGTVASTLVDSGVYLIYEGSIDDGSTDDGSTDEDSDTIVVALRLKAVDSEGNAIDGLLDAFLNQTDWVGTDACDYSSVMCYIGENDLEFTENSYLPSGYDLPENISFTCDTNGKITVTSGNADVEEVDGIIYIVVSLPEYVCEHTYDNEIYYCAEAGHYTRCDNCDYYDESTFEAHTDEDGGSDDLCDTCNYFLGNYTLTVTNADGETLEDGSRVFPGDVLTATYSDTVVYRWCAYDPNIGGEGEYFDLSNEKTYTVDAADFEGLEPVLYLYITHPVTNEPFETIAFEVASVTSETVVIPLSLKAVDSDGNVIFGHLDVKLNDSHWIGTYSAGDEDEFECNVGVNTLSNWDYCPEYYVRPDYDITFTVDAEGTATITSGNATVEVEDGYTYIVITLEAEEPEEITELSLDQTTSISSGNVYTYTAQEDGELYINFTELQDVGYNDVMLGECDLNDALAILINGTPIDSLFNTVEVSEGDTVTITVHGEYGNYLYTGKVFLTIVNPNSLLLGDNAIKQDIEYTYTAEQDGELHVIFHHIFDGLFSWATEEQLNDYFVVYLNDEPITAFENIVEVSEGDEVTIRMEALDGDEYSGIVNLSWDGLVDFDTVPLFLGTNVVKQDIEYTYTAQEDGDLCITVKTLIDDDYYEIEEEWLNEYVAIYINGEAITAFENTVEVSEGDEVTVYIESLDEYLHLAKIHLAMNDDSSAQPDGPALTKIELEGDAVTKNPNGSYTLVAPSEEDAGIPCKILFYGTDLEELTEDNDTILFGMDDQTVPFVALLNGPATEYDPELGAFVMSGTLDHLSAGTIFHYSFSNDAGDTWSDPIEIIVVNETEPVITYMEFVGETVTEEDGQYTAIVSPEEDTYVDMVFYGVNLENFTEDNDRIKVLMEASGRELEIPLASMNPVYDPELDVLRVANKPLSYESVGLSLTQSFSNDSGTTWSTPICLTVGEVISEPVEIQVYLHYSEMTSHGLSHTSEEDDAWHCIYAPAGESLEITAETDFGTSVEIIARLYDSNGETVLKRLYSRDGKLTIPADMVCEGLMIDVWACVDIKINLDGGSTTDALEESPYFPEFISGDGYFIITGAYDNMCLFPVAYVAKEGHTLSHFVGEDGTVFDIYEEFNEVDIETSTEDMEVSAVWICDELTYVEAQDATCTEDGHIQHYKCEACGKTYADADGTEEIENVTLTDPDAHDYIPDTYTYNDETHTATYICSRNSDHTYTGEAEEHTYQDGVCICGKVETTGPSIIRQPVDAEVDMGEIYRVSVEAEGEGLKYQWYLRNAGSDTWYASAVKTRNYSGTMTAARANREIYCVITDANGNTVTSEIVKLNLKPTELQIITQPTSVEVELGGIYRVSVEAKGEGLRYQWYIRNEGSDIWAVSAVKTKNYSGIMTTARANREVYCVITDAKGNTVTTDTVKLNLKPAQLQIVTQPQSVEVALGEAYRVSVKAKGEGLKYQWYLRNAGSDQWFVSAVKSGNYSGTMTTARANREVYCVITDANGNTVTSEIVKLNLKAAE